MTIETNAKRLERAKNYLQNTFIALARKNGKTQMCEDLTYLIQQAERVQELEYENLKYKKRFERQLNVFQENTRFREALEFYATDENYKRRESDFVIGYPEEVLMDGGGKARKALKGES